VQHHVKPASAAPEKIAAGRSSHCVARPGNVRLVAAFNNGDAEGVEQRYTEQARALSRGAPTVKG
jgi:hypothetical protein